jgi:glycosyltransferase involved in cell wall biosynthesis
MTLDVAVVIPTRGRESRLAFALEALAYQTLAPERFEVIIVRDADAPGPLAQIPEGLSVRYVTAPGSHGPVVKRNLGWREASAPLVAFTDDDCRPEPRWLEGLLDAARGENAFLQGRTEPDPAERHLLYGLARSMKVVGPSDWFETCNIAYPRSLLERLGGFDESFEFVGDDTDLGWRAIAAGAARIYVDDARVRHAVLPRSLPRALREQGRFVTAPLMVSRHPQLRENLYARYFVSQAHAALALALAGALTRRPLVAALASIAYIDPSLSLHRLPRRALARVLLHLPARAAVDAAEMVALLRGSVRYRAPLV